MSITWLRGQDSNLRPRGYEPRELPLLHPASSGTVLYQTGVNSSIISVLAMQEEIYPRLEVILVGWRCGSNAVFGVIGGADSVGQSHAFGHHDFFFARRRQAKILARRQFKVLAALEILII